MFTFPVFDQKYSFYQILSKKSKFSVKAEIWYQEKFEYGVSVHSFSFRREKPFLDKFCLKNQFKLKFVICTNSNMENSVVMFTFFFEQKYFSSANLVPNIKINFI